ncbi:MAG: ABC transporter permease, partial [Treponema sp.]
MNRKNLFSSWTWIYFVSRRFSSVDRKGRSAVTGFLAALGIALGVMTLITVLGVMNGFQMSFVDAIMEISSY